MDIFLQFLLFALKMKMYLAMLENSGLIVYKIKIYRLTISMD